MDKASWMDGFYGDSDVFFETVTNDMGVITYAKKWGNDGRLYTLSWFAE